MNYTYDKDDSITNINFNDNNINYIYDSLGRLKEKNIDGSNKVTYEYQSNGNKTSLNIKELTINNDKYQYNYDKLNNITEIYINNELINKYEYDNQNQLIKEKNYKTNKLIEYNYDTEGNIKKMQEYNLKENTLIKIDNYEYNNQNWKDQLTKYNNEEIVYDEIGNPTSIGQNIKMTWTNGRTLKSYEDTSKNLVINYTYDIDGIRTSKTVNSEKTEYYTENNHIIFEKTGNHMLYYIRDDEGALEGFKYDDIVYYYEKNLADDIIGILNQNKEKIATYEYDSWGNILSIKDENKMK